MSDEVEEIRDYIERVIDALKKAKTQNATTTYLIEEGGYILKNNDLIKLDM